MCEIDIGNPKYTRNTLRLLSSGTKIFTTFRHDERETQSFYAVCFYIVNFQPNQRAAPVAHKFVWPRPALNLDTLVRRQELWFFSNPQNPQPTLPVHDVIHAPWFYFQSGVLFWHLWMTHPHRENRRSYLHLTNPCTEPKGSHPN